MQVTQRPAPAGAWRSARSSQFTCDHGRDYSACAQLPAPSSRADFSGQEGGVAPERENASRADQHSQVSPRGFGKGDTGHQEADSLLAGRGRGLHAFWVASTCSANPVPFAEETWTRRNQGRRLCNGAWPPSFLLCLPRPSGCSPVWGPLPCHPRPRSSPAFTRSPLFPAASLLPFKGKCQNTPGKRGPIVLKQ